MRVHFHDDYVVDLPAGHAFPMPKFRLLRDILLREGLVRPEDVVAPEEASWELLALAHGPEYLRDLRDGTLPPPAIRRLGLPWSPALVRRSRRATMGTLMAAEEALRAGIAANLAGGTRHACRDHGEGYCVINDAVVACRSLKGRGLAERVLLVDLDVHQGNGNAELLAADPWAFTFSMHGERNYPTRKPPSDLDVGLPDGTGDDAYLAALAAALDESFARSRPELVLYIAGADPYAGDRLGRLALSKEGLLARDRAVLAATRGAGLPVAIVCGGGYCPDVDEIVDIHAATMLLAARWT